MDFARLIEVWKTHRITVHFADLGVDLSTPAGALVANIMASVAQGQSDLLSERNREIAQHVRRLRRPLNQLAPVGFSIAGPKGKRYLVANQAERRVMARIAQLRDNGLTWQEISDRIEGEICRAVGRELPSSPSAKRTWSRYRCRRAHTAYQRIIAAKRARA